MNEDLLNKPLVVCTLGDFIKALRMTEQSEETCCEYGFTYQARKDSYGEQKRVF